MICTLCNKEKSLDEFKRTNKGAIWPRCKDCFNEMQRAKRAAGGDDKYKGRYRDRQRKYMRERRYGITDEQYNEMVREHGGVCAICKFPCISGMGLSVDHNHKTGEVRGLLCKSCNLALAAVDENEDLVYSLLDYIRKYSHKDIIPEIRPSLNYME